MGRTGAGKSSIIQALFRLAPATAAIEIDQIRIGSVPLRRHRGAISIIPQEPVIFSGSLRHNLDPFGTLEDGQIWRALEQVNKYLSPGLVLSLSTDFKYSIPTRA